MAERPVLRSFLCPNGANGRVKLRAIHWLGVTASPKGPVVLVCAMESDEVKKSGLLNAQGLQMAPTQIADTPEWDILVLTDGQVPPAGAQYVGGIVGNKPDGQMAGVFVFAREVTSDAS